MTTQLIGQIIELCILGLALFIACVYTMKLAIVEIIKWYFSAKLTYTSAIMLDKPVDTLHEMAQELAKRQAARTMANGKGKEDG